ncbi:export protein [Natrinema thermotolerans DSM 11552]|nr:export protein [Natrinema thermotolerans DSM 11552]
MIDRLQTVYDRLTAGGSTAEQAIQSGIWVAGINVADRILQLLKVVILARLLSPAAFGLLGIALLAIAALRQFSKLGFDEALIQHEDDDVDAYLNTAWVMKIIRGFGIAVVAFLAAPYLAVFFGEPQAEPIIRAVGISPLILSLQNPAVMYFQKNLNFHKEFVYQVGGRLVDLTVAVVIALVFRSVWALVVGIVAMNFVKFAISYSIHEYRPNIDFNLAYGKEMFGFGKWMFASSILVFLYGQGDDAFVGWYFTAVSLGFYQMAYRFSNAPATEVTHVISQVSFPAFSKIQNNVEGLREGYLRTVQLSVIIAFPMAAGIAAVSSQFVYVVLGEQWKPVVPLMQVLSIWGGSRAFGAVGGSVFKSVGRPELGVYVQLIKVLAIALLIFPAVESFGVVGVALAIIGSTIISLSIHLYLILSIIEANIKQLLSIVIYPLIGSLSMFSVVWVLDDNLSPGIIELVSLILTGMVTYVVFMITVEKLTSYEFLHLYRLIRDTI